jgi:hypothetical protein
MKTCIIIIALSNPARDNMHDHQASAQILTGDAKILQEREREREREQSATGAVLARSSKEPGGI